MSHVRVTESTFGELVRGPRDRSPINFLFCQLFLISSFNLCIYIYI